MAYPLTLNGQYHISAVLRLIALFAGISQLLFGEAIIAIAIFVCVGAISLPSLFTRGNVTLLPIEFELIFITMVMLQFVIGETLDFYESVPYYDKFIHFSLPLFVGFISFMIAYTLHQLKLLNISTVPLMFAIVFMTLGVGAAWEIIEYLSDAFLHPKLDSVPHLQGSVVESAIDDTMRDLTIDFLGGVIGAALGLRYISSTRSNVRIRLLRLVKEISTNFKAVKSDGS